MIKTVKDALDQKGEIVARMDKNWYGDDDRRSSMGAPYDWVGMERIELLPDDVVLRLIEALYIHNTHFVPGKLPGNAMAIGDIVDLNGATYMTTSWGVMNCNVTMLHAARAYEAQCIDRARAGRDAKESFVQLNKELRELRHKHHHKGSPYVDDGIFGLSAPAASGGASWHSIICSDDVMEAVPYHSLLFIIGAQADRTGIKHIGAGHVVGKHFVLVLPKEPLLAIQARIDADPALAKLWPEVQEVDAELENVQKWIEATRAHKQDVVRIVAPDIIRDRALGFHLDLTVGNRGAQLSPVCAESHLTKHRDELGGVPTRWNEFAYFLYETKDSYGKPRSLFDPPAAVA